MEVLAIIGARSGSKSVKDKNIALVDGKPLLGRIIETARSSRNVNRVIVSTDSPEYAAVARDYHAETPFLRPAELAGELSPEFEYVRHALQWLEENEGYVPDIAVRCMATVPLQRTEDIEGAIRLARRRPFGRVCCRRCRSTPASPQSPQVDTGPARRSARGIFFGVRPGRHPDRPAKLCQGVLSGEHHRFPPAGHRAHAIAYRR